jgi:hypothetical protein
MGVMVYFKPAEKINKLVMHPVCTKLYFFNLTILNNTMNGIECPTYHMVGLLYITPLPPSNLVWPLDLACPHFCYQQLVCSILLINHTFKSPLQLLHKS